MAEPIEIIKEYIYERNLHLLKSTIPLDFSELVKFNVTAAEFLLDEPSLVLNSLKDEFGKPIELFNLPKTQKVPIANLRSKHLNKLLVVEGIIRQKSVIRPKVSSTLFECTNCGQQINLIQLGSEIKQPYKCPSCGGKSFRIVRKELIDIQSIIIEESLENNIYDKAPRLRLLLEGEELTSPEINKKLLIGNKIEAVGILREMPLKNRKGKQIVNLDFYLEVNHIQVKGTTFEEIYSKITPEDIKKFKSLDKSKVFDMMTRAILPNIYGHRLLKEALTLLLFGGVRKERHNDFPLRGDFHLLLVGDPGTAKSSILTRMAMIAPKSRLVSAASATGVGFTATLVRDEFLKGYALEAGALILANNGLVCIDELDKASDEDRKYLHQAMEQQIVTINKANIQETLQCRTTVLAAANPKLGRFDIYQPLAKQIDLTPPLLNRFDLIYPLQDVPNEEEDLKVANFILNKHTNVRNYNTEDNPFHNIDFFRKYIAYAKQNYFPKLTPEAKKIIVDYYVSLRRSAQSGTIPITARQIEALIRISEASARARLSNEVNEEDAQRAVNLLHTCLQKLSLDVESGSLDIDRLATGITSSFKKKYYIVWQKLLELNAYDNLIDLHTLREVCEIPDPDFTEIIEKMKRNGDIYEPVSGHVKFV